MTMKKQIIYMVCATALLCRCHIYKTHDVRDSLDATGIYRDPVSETDTLASAGYDQYGKPSLEGSFVIRKFTGV